MIIHWHGQSAYTLTGTEHTVTIDPFGPFPPEVAARITFDYPPIAPHPAHVLLVTHEHRDHNAVEVVTGDPHVIRSHRRALRIPARRGRRHRVGARPGCRHGTRAEHDLRVLV